MFKINDDEKEGRKAALSKLRQVMRGETGKKLGALKRPGEPGKGAPATAKHEDDGLEGPGEPATGAPSRATAASIDLGGPGEPGDGGDDADQGGYCPHCGNPTGRG